MENKSGTSRRFDVHAGQMSSGVSQVSTGRSRKTQLSFRATIKSSVFVNAAFFEFHLLLSSFSSASETTTPLTSFFSSLFDHCPLILEIPLVLFACFSRSPLLFPASVLPLR